MHYSTQPRIHTTLGGPPMPNMAPGLDPAYSAQDLHRFSQNADRFSNSNVSEARAVSSRPLSASQQVFGFVFGPPFVDISGSGSANFMLSILKTHKEGASYWTFQLKREGI